MSNIYTFFGDIRETTPLLHYYRKNCYFNYMKLENIYIVLSRPEESRNIGAACRAMANNGIKHLRIVGKREDFDDERVRILAIHAVNLWDNCEFFPSITEAIKDCAIAFGTTRRKGKKRRDTYYFPEDAAEKADELTSSDAKVAVIFGNERTGLTDEEVNECTGAVTIPSCEEFASLNLSHAVQIISYHMFRQNEKTSRGITGSGFSPVPLSRVQSAVKSITDNLQKIGFFKITGREDQERYWIDILSRAALSEGEIKYLEKIFSKASGLSAKNKTEN